MKTLTKNCFVVQVNDKILLSLRKFDKKKIQRIFVDAVLQSEPGDEIEYWKSSDKYAYEPMITVENVDGKHKRLIVKGDKTYYKSFNYFKHDE